VYLKLSCGILWLVADDKIRSGLCFGGERHTFINIYLSVDWLQTAADGCRNDNRN
jgi:hypothetical protein